MLIVTVPYQYFAICALHPRSIKYILCFEEPVEDDELESPLYGMGMGLSGRGRGIRGVGPGRRMMKLGVGGFFVKVRLNVFGRF